MVAQSKLTFPLLKLPYLAILDVLEKMDLPYLMMLSLFSRKMKRLVKSVGPPVVRTIINVKEVGYDELYIFYNLRHVRYHVAPSLMEIGGFLRLSLVYRPSILRKIGVSKKKFKYREYILHFLDVTNSSGIVLDMQDVLDPHPVEYYRNLLRGIKVDGLSLKLAKDRSRAFMPHLEEYFNVNELQLLGDPIDENLLKRIFERDFVSLVIHNNIHVDLRQLIQTRNQSIKMDRVIIDSADLNCFPKAWINHETNPNLQSLDMFMKSGDTDTRNPQIVFDGIDFEKIKLEKGVASMKFYWTSFFVVHGITDGYIISRKDGRKAVVELKLRCFFKFIVL